MKNTERKLIDVATELFWKLGYESTSVNDIVKEAGVSKGAYFHYYSTKKDIALAALNLYAEEQLLEDMDRFFEENSDAKDAIKLYIQHLFNLGEQYGFSGGCMLGNFALELTDKDEDIRRCLDAIFSRWKFKLIEMLNPLEEQGRLSVSPNEIASLFISNLQGVTLTTKVHRDAKQAQTEVSVFLRVIDFMIKEA